GEVGVEQGGVVGRERRTDAGRHELWQGVLLKRADDPGAEVRERADVEHGAAVGELGDEAGILDGSDAVPEPVGIERLERAAHGHCASGLARMWDGREPELVNLLEDVGVGLRRALGLAPPEAHADDAAVAVARRPLDGGARLVLLEPTWDVRRQPYLDPVKLARFLRTRTDALEDLLPVAAASRTLGRREDPL